MTSRKVACDSCEVLVINNIVCHEHGCPEDWKDETRTCKWCGTKFRAKHSSDLFCSDDCQQTYYL